MFIQSHWLVYELTKSNILLDKAHLCEVHKCPFKKCTVVNSRKMFVVAYPCETQEMVLDAHNKAFVFFGGVPLRLVYDNLKPD